MEVSIPALVGFRIPVAARKRRERTAIPGDERKRSHVFHILLPGRQRVIGRWDCICTQYCSSSFGVLETPGTGMSSSKVETPVPVQETCSDFCESVPISRFVQRSVKEAFESIECHESGEISVADRQGSLIESVEKIEHSLFYPLLPCIVR